jgi:hypothetical protein
MLSSDEKEIAVEFKNALVADVHHKFSRAEINRTSRENRWSKSYHNYRGQYYKDVRFTDEEKSKVFVKITKTKVLAAYGQLIDLLFSAGKLPISIKRTPVPTTSSQSAPPVDFGMEDVMGEGETSLPFDVGYSGDGMEVPKGAGFDVMSQARKQTPPQGPQEAPGAIPGMPPMPGPTPMPPTPEKPLEDELDVKARRLEKLIFDQLGESDATKVVRNSLFETCLLGTGVVKGPFNDYKTSNSWTSEGGQRSLQQKEIRVPKIEFVSVWNFYPDPEAQSIEECDWVIQRHRLSKTQMIALKRSPHFNSDNIDKAIKGGPNYQSRDFEHTKQAEDSTIQDNSNRWEVFEYWGMMDVDTIRSFDADLVDFAGDPEVMDVQINAWVCGGEVLRVNLNPFQPVRIPYMMYHYEKDPYSIWGVGVAENMEDMQALMNGNARMAVDNIALAGNLIFDIDEASLVPGQDYKIYPGKKFVRQAGGPGQSIYGLKFPNTAPENMQMFDRWRQLADEATGIPSYSHGYTGVTGMTRTASGMSMLMSAANLNIKTAVKNIDDALLEPLAKYMFYWNMQFYEGDLDVVGDLEIKATGTQSLVQKEVRSQRLMTFLQLASNPQIGPMVNVSYLISGIAESLDLDVDRVLNNMDMAAQQAQIVGMQNQMMGGGGGPAGMLGGSTGTGDGTIAPGNAAQPGMEEFAGNDQMPEGA